jgi:hypothetical protein
VDLVWRQSFPGVDRYWLEGDTDSLFTSPFVDSLLTDTTYTVDPLHDSSTFWWRVRAHNDVGWGLFSEVRSFSVLFNSIPCDSVDQFQARCRSGGTIQARIVLLNSTGYAGEHVIMGIDGVNYTLDVITNGTHSKAQTQLAGQSAGDHTVMLVSPTGCFDPVTVTCSADQASGEDDWLWDEEEWTDASSLSVANGDLPLTTRLLGSYPNPFNPATTFRYALGEDTHVTLKVYNMLGQLVATVVDESQLAGHHSARWDGSNEFGQRVSSGIYIYRMTAGNVVETKRMILLK